MAYHLVVCFDRLTRVSAPASGPPPGSPRIPSRPASVSELHALEMALCVHDEHAARVTALALGAEACCDPLREALYRGAHEAILVTDPRLAGWDPLAAGYALACALRTIGPDLVVCPSRTIDGDTASCGVQAATRLGLVPITSVDRPIAIEGNAVTARRDTGGGWEIVSAPLPVLLTVANAANTPRPPAMKRLMKYKKARSRGELEGVSGQPGAKGLTGADLERECASLEARGLLIRTWNLDDIGADPSRCGAGGSPTRIERVQSLDLSDGGFQVFENTDAGIARLVDALLRDHTI